MGIKSVFIIWGVLFWAPILVALPENYGLIEPVFKLTMSDSLDEEETPLSCENLPVKLGEFNGKLVPIYSALGEFVLDLSFQFKGLHEKLSAWEAKPVEILPGSFNFVGELAETIEESASNIEEKAMSLEDVFYPLKEKVTECRPNLERLVEQLELDLGDHIIESRDFVSSIALLLSEYHSEWSDLEKEGGATITFPQGTFQRLEVLKEKLSLGHVYVNENSQYVLSRVTFLVEQLSREIQNKN